MDLLTAILTAALGTAAPILYASVGEIISERAGVLNLGLEGIMLLGAVSGYIVAVQTASLPLAVLAAFLTGALVGLFYAFMTVTLQANQIVCGLALVIAGNGLSGFFGRVVFGRAASVSFGRRLVPGLSGIPFFGPILFNQNVMVYGLYFLVPLVWFYLYKTRPGLKLRALGENPGALDAVGIHVFSLRYLYVMAGSAIAALGGAYITLAYTPSWTAGITAGRGWIAAALVIFASWNPAVAALGAVLFGGVEVLGLRLQVIGIDVPSHFIKTLPYLCTVVVLILTTGSFRKRKSPAPAALGRHYDREAR
ncbi:MAG: ABC transporter permease [Spirochaetaceae bacterium]|jgi:simple sugar transport system permease protein|nr:ABC transporter permease [Spirochaetaceae bacterium]